MHCQILLTVEHSRSWDVETLGGAQNTLGHFAIEARIIGGQDVVVVHVDQLVRHAEGIEDGGRDGKCPPIVFVVEIAVGAEGDTALERLAIEGA